MRTDRVDQVLAHAHAHHAAPGAHADHGRELLELDRHREDVAVRAGELVGQHDERAVEHAARVGKHTTAARAEDA